MTSDHDRGTSAADELTSLREEFRGFRIWKEVIGERTRYIARGFALGSHPHTAVTADLGELRTALSLGTEQQAAATPYDTRVPNIARMYNYWIGGKDHLAADRQAADGVTADFPEVAQVARANRKFVTRAVRYVAEQGITQFIDVGAGLPARPAVHEIAQAVNPAARVAYVDNDKLVLAHARALLAGGAGSQRGRW
jgi:S-adenosyl methyltransferase